MTNHLKHVITSNSPGSCHGHTHQRHDREVAKRGKAKVGYRRGPCLHMVSASFVSSPCYSLPAHVYTPTGIHCTLRPGCYSAHVDRVVVRLRPIISICIPVSDVNVNPIVTAFGRPVTCSTVGFVLWNMRGGLTTV